MKPKSTLRFSLPFPLAAAIASLLAATSASATNLWWDTNGVTTANAAATGTWTTGSAANWTTVLAGNLATAAVTTTNSDDLTFNATGMTTATVTVSGTQSARTITFNTAMTLSGGTIDLGNAAAGSGLIFGNVVNNIQTAITINSAATSIAFRNDANQGQIFSSAGTITGTATTGNTQTLNIVNNSGGGQTLGGIIGDGGAGGKVALTLRSSNGTTNILSAANSYTGATNILVGTLQIGNAATFTNTSAINLSSFGRLDVNVANQSLAKLSTGVVAGSFLRYSQAQGSGTTGPGTIFGTVELNHAGVNPNYVLDFGTGSTLTNVITTNYTPALTLSGSASIDASPATVTHTATYGGGITASTAGAKTLSLTGTNTAANTISGAIGNGSGTISIAKEGAGNWIFSGANTYTGTTLVNVGTLQFAKQASLYNGNTGSWTATNINVKDAATLALNVDSAGTNGFDSTNLNTLLSNISVANNAAEGLQSGANLGIDTSTATGATFTQGNVIANSTGVNGGVIGLTKLGAGTLVLDQANTYTGRTLISGGTLQLGNGGTTGKLSTTSTIFNNGTLTINRSNAVAQGTDFSATPISGTGAFIQAGSGTTTLSSANTYTGSTTVSGGVLNLTNALALQNSALVTTGAGTLTVTGPTTLTLGGLSGATGNLASIFTSGFTGAVTNLTLNPSTGVTNTYSGIIADGSTGMTLTKTGAGTQSLSGVNSYTGATTVNGGTLNLGGGTSTGSLASTVLNLGGGTLSYTRTGSQTQTFTTTNINSGASGATTVAGNFLKLGDIVRNLGGTLNVGNVGAITTTDTNVLGILGGWATYNNENWAVANGGASAITALGTYTVGNATAATYSNANIDVATATVGGTINANSLRFSGAGARTLTLATGDNIIQSGGILVRSDVGNNLSTITGGNLLGSASGELIVHQHNTSNSLTIASSIRDNVGATALTKSGAGTLTLTGANLYTGGTIINAGTLSGNVANFLPASSNVTVNPGGTLNYGAAVTYNALNVTLNGGNLNAVEGAASSVLGTFTLGAGTTSTISNGGRSANFSGNFTGSGNLNSTAAGNRYFLSGTNDYTGTTLLSGVTGNVVFTKPSALYNSVQANWTPANITVNSGAILGIRGGDGTTTGFTSAQINTLLSNLSTVNNNGLLAGSLVNIDTTTASFNHTGVISDSSGPGGGSVGVYVTPGNTLTLSGANTYTGKTILRGYFAGDSTTLSVSSLNSVFTNATLGTVHSASSNLGAPTTVANGTINLGSNSAQVVTTLIYTGTGETTDRIIAIEGNASSTLNIYQSGSGLLKFTSPFTANNSGTPINLRGVGNGEVAGIGANGTLTKLDAGTWTIAGRNLTLGTTTVSGGALVLGHAEALNGGIGSTGGVAGLTFNGGVIGLGVGDFSRPLAAAGTAGGTTFTGAGGWAAYGADRAVNLGGASASVTWATANTGFNGQTLILSNITATHTVDLQNPLDLGNAARTVQVDNGAATIDGKLSGILSGVGGGLTKTGLGTLTLTNSNSYTGVTAVNGGNLLLDMTGTGALASTSALTLGGGNFSIKGGTTSAQTLGTLTLTANTNNSITLDPNNGTSTTLTLGNAWTRGAGSSLLIDYSSSNTGTREVVTAAATTGVVLSNGIYGGLLVKDSGGITGFATRAAGATQAITRYDDTTGTTLVDNSNTASTNFTTRNTVYTLGTLTWNNGTTNRSINSLTIDTTNNGGIIDMGISTNILTLTSGAILFKGANNVTLTGGQVGAAATEVIVHQTGAGSLTINSLISSGAGSLTKDGTGTLIIGGAKTYTGATNVNAGTLLINGSTAAGSTFTVASGATLGGTGTIGGAVNVSGTLSPGASIETLGSGALSFANNSSLVYELDSSVATSAGSDLLKVTGNLNLTGTVALTFADLALTDTAFTVGTVFSLINYTGTWNNGLFTYEGNSLADDEIFAIGGLNTWQISYNDANGGLNFSGEYAGGADSFVNITAMTAVPEPGAALIGSLGLLALLRRRRA